MAVSAKIVARRRLTTASVPTPEPGRRQALASSRRIGRPPHGGRPISSFHSCAPACCGSARWGRGLSPAPAPRGRHDPGELIGALLNEEVPDGVVADGFGSSAAPLGPLGWLPEVRAFEVPRACPLLAYGAAAAALLVAAGVTAQHRDLGSGVLAARPGPSSPRHHLATCGGYAWRLLRPGLSGGSP